MAWVAVAIGGSALVGGYLSNQASQNAASAQENAANAANATSLTEYNQTRQDQAPWRAAGEAALGELTGKLPALNKPFSMADFQADPGYQFRMNQGTQALQRSAAARGTLGGDTLKAITNYGQDAASSEYQNAFDRYNTNNSNTFNRLASVAGIGQQATNATDTAGMNTANNISQNQIGAGNAAAAGYVGGANSINNAIGQGMNTWMGYQLMNRMAPAGTNSPY